MACPLEVGLRQKLVLAREMDLMPARRLSRVIGSAPRRAREEFQTRPLGGRDGPCEEQSLARPDGTAWSPQSYPDGSRPAALRARASASESSTPNRQ